MIFPFGAGREAFSWILTQIKLFFIKANNREPEINLKKA